MTPWPFALTTAAVVHGAVYLLGATAPIDKVYVDGRRVPDVISTVALYGEANGSDFPEQAVSVVVPLPDRVGVGVHRLRVVSGGHSWHRTLTVAVAPAMRAAEVGAWCMVLPDWHPGRLFVDSADPRGNSYWLRVGVLVRDAAGVRALPVAHDQIECEVRSGDYVTTQGVADGTVIQVIYADGSLGERWEFNEKPGYGACHTVEQPLPGGPGIPLWKDAASGPP